MATATETLTPPPSAGATEWRPSAAGWAARIGILAFLFLALIWTISQVSDVWASRIAGAAIFAIIGLSLNIVMGYVGQVSLGHHAFVGLAAFAFAQMVTKQNQPFPVAILVACIFGGLSAGLLGLVALRIKGLYLALITLTYGFVAVNSFFEIPALTGGGQGLAAERPSIASSDAAFAYMCLAFLGLVIFIDWRLLSSKLGRGILAIKESEAVASSYAVNVTAYKVIAFVISGVFAGLAGALFASNTEQVVAADFNFAQALLWVLMVVVGGLGNRVGVVIGSAFFALFTELIGLFGPLEHFLTETFHRAPEEFEGLIGALLALLTIILHPGGISDQVAPLVRWFSGKKFSFHGDDDTPAEPKSANKLVKALGMSDSKTGPLPETADASGDAAAAATDGPAKEPAVGSLSAALGHASGAAEDSSGGNGHTASADEETSETKPEEEKA
jgi:branched-chain amino acid transport system permease protein